MLHRPVVTRWVGHFEQYPHVQLQIKEAVSLKQSDDFRLVELTHSWLNHYRSCSFVGKRKIEDYEAMLHFACGLIVWSKSFLGKILSE